MSNLSHTCAVSICYEFLTFNLDIKKVLTSQYPKEIMK